MPRATKRNAVLLVASVMAWGSGASAETCHRSAVSAGGDRSGRRRQPMNDLRSRPVP